MKKVIFYLLLSALTAVVYAQDRKGGWDNIGKNPRKVKGDKYTFWVSDCDILQRFVDVNDSLRLIQYKTPDQFPFPKVENYKEIFLLVKDAMVQTLEENHLEVLEEECVMVVLIAGQDHVVREGILSFPRRWKMPVERVEKCMQALQSGICTMKFPLTFRGKEVLKLQYAIPYYYENIKEYQEEKKR